MNMVTRSEYSASNRFLIGLLAGGAIGAALAMVCAPRIGGLRRRVSASTAELAGRVTRTYQEVSARATGAVDGLAGSAQSVRDDVADVIAGGARHVEQLAMAAKSGPADRGSSSRG
jgi:gas vesicle protein